MDADTGGYFCIFREAFLTGRFAPGVGQLPPFRPGGEPTYALDARQEAEASALFEKLLAGLDSDHALRDDLLRTHTEELLHYALQLRPVDLGYAYPDAKARLASVFAELSERQFPIESPARRLTLRAPSDFAERLAVHVNHLNRCLRAATGKTTSAHIADRLADEAGALLKHTDWTVTEVGYSLGFDELAHFSAFFKKQTGVAPSAYRRV